MISQMCTHPRQISQRLDALRFQVISRTYPRQHQQLRRRKSALTDDDFPCRADSFTSYRFNTNGAVILNFNLCNMLACQNG